MVVLNVKLYLFTDIHLKNINYYLFPVVSMPLVLANKHPLSLPLTYFMTDNETQRSKRQSQGTKHVYYRVCWRTEFGFFSRPREWGLAQEVKVN